MTPLPPRRHAGLRPPLARSPGSADTVNVPLPVRLLSNTALPGSLMGIVRFEPTCSVRWPWSPW